VNSTAPRARGLVETMFRSEKFAISISRTRSNVGLATCRWNRRGYVIVNPYWLSVYRAAPLALRYETGTGGW